MVVQLIYGHGLYTFTDNDFFTERRLTKLIVFVLLMLVFVLILRLAL